LLAEWLVRDLAAGWAVHALAAAWITASYAAFAAAQGLYPVRNVLESLATAVRFLLAAMLAALVASLGYEACFALAEGAGWRSFVGGVLRYWIGDMNGILLLAPLLLALPRAAEALRALRAGWSVALAQVLLTVLLVWLQFATEVFGVQRVFYPLFVPMIWIAVRWGGGGALLAALAIQVGMVLALREATIEARPIDLQLIVLTLTVTGMVLGVAVTERVRARMEALERDRQLSRAMRYAVAGEMSSALTHELNQPMTALVSYLQAARLMLTPADGSDDRLAGTLGKANREAIRAADVLRRLRDFYRGTGTPATGSADPAACCASVLELLEPRLRRQAIQLRLALPPNLPAVAAPRTQVEVVLHNLVSNALEALAAQAAERRQLLVEALVQGGNVVLSVQDSGTGVAETALPQLFEPFNTTKPDGMGLGLAISRNLVAALGGELTYRRSAALGGACFEIRLPKFK
jgi:signal transduction histidine kinase